MVLKERKSSFACDKTEVYGEVELELGDGLMVQGHLLICQKKEHPKASLLNAELGVMMTILQCQ